MLYKVNVKGKKKRSVTRRFVGDMALPRQLSLFMSATKAGS